MSHYDFRGLHRQLEMVQESLRVQDWARQIDKVNLSHLDHARWQVEQVAAGITKQLQDIRTSSVFQAVDRASVDALASLNIKLTPFLDSYRTEQLILRDRILIGQQNAWWNDASLLPSFTQASALADSIAAVSRVNRAILESSRLFNETAMPVLSALAEYRQFFDSAGLLLPRWPRVKRLDERDKNRQFAQRLRQNKPSIYIRKATTLFHQYERVLRQIINAVMEDQYGEEWAVERLPLCGCKDLLGKWQKAGYGEVLDFADYHHYKMIMNYAEHFEHIFGRAFDDPEILTTLVTTAAKYRGDTHHARDTFGPSDLLDLRVTWNTLRSGLIALMPDYELDNG